MVVLRLRIRQAQPDVAFVRLAVSKLSVGLIRAHDRDHYGAPEKVSARERCGLTLERERCALAALCWAATAAILVHEAATLQFEHPVCQAECFGAVRGHNACETQQSRLSG